MRLALEFEFSDCEGAVAQLGEHLVCNQGVTSSILVSSTIVRYKALFADNAL